MPKKILLYAHDGVGYGHIARMSNLGTALIKEGPGFQIDLVTGYQSIGTFLPPNHSFTVIKIPSNISRATITDPITEQRYHQRITDRKEAWRKIFLQNTYDYWVIDFFPNGTGGELTELLYWVKTTNTQIKFILTLRGVIFSAAKTQAFYQRNDSLRLINDLYDRVIVFCDPQIVDLNAEYFSGKITKPIHYLGYLYEKDRLVKAEPHSDHTHVMIDFGGGFECDELLLATLNALNKSDKHYVITVLLGEYYQQETIEIVISQNDGINVHRQPFPSGKVIQPVHVVIGCGGYHVTVNCIFNSIPLLVIPKDELEEAGIHINRLKKFASINITPKDRICTIDTAIQTLLESPSIHSLNSCTAEGLAVFFND
ncbi:hypothetical protein ACFFGT_19275 [Mucilaginibacter angelicae]|uniref:Glycosyl transferase family 28 C-terminal domain-containing protein n=1 Tax=Mucilaginibacter angelicae TaxID=869718 RepID=A0ABV6LA57_9SPHI